MSGREQDKRVEQQAFDAWVSEAEWKTFTDGSMQRLADTFAAEAGAGRVLDLACGSGEYTEHLARGRSGVVAADLSMVCARACKRRVPAAGVLAADAERLPFRDATFSAVFLGNVLHHFPEAGRLLAECHRVLAPGGTVFAVDPNPQNPVVFVYRVLLGSRSMKTENEVLLWPRALEASLRGAGFSEVRVESALPIYFLRDYYQRALGEAFSFAVYPVNLLERALFALPSLGRRTGSFTVSRAVKPAAR